MSEEDQTYGAGGSIHPSKLPVDEDEDDAPCELELVLPLTYDEERSGQLGTVIYKNTTEAELHEPRDLIAAKEHKDVYYFHVRFSKAEFGAFEGQPACLLVLNFEFQQLSSSRYKKAVIEIAFEDASLDPNDPHGDDEADLEHQPRILAYSPHEYHGPTVSRDGESEVGLSVSLSSPGGVASVTPGYRKKTPFVAEDAFKMHGVVKDKPPSRVVWTVRENSVTKGGIRSSFSTAIIISYTPHRRFGARIKVEADVWLSLFVKPICGAKDDPIYLDPDRMIQRLPNSHGHDLKSYDLNKMTRLDVDGGRFL